MSHNDEIYQTNLWPELLNKIKEKKITKAYQIDHANLGGQSSPDYNQKVDELEDSADFIGQLEFQFDETHAIL